MHSLRDSPNNARCYQFANFSFGDDGEVDIQTAIFPLHGAVDV